MKSSKFCDAFAVTRQAPELIGPAESTPREIKLLSDIDDQQGLWFHVPILLFYKNNQSSMRGKDPVKVIREALRKALVYYYPLAGRLKESYDKKLMVHCNNEGLMFIEADANVELDQLADAIYPPCPYLDKLLYDVPNSDGIVDSPILVIQVTRFTCGGIAIAIRMNHTMTDAFGLKNFLKTTEEMAKDADIPSIFPVWERHIFNARNPPQITCTHHEYNEFNNTKDIFLTINPDEMVQKSFYFGPKEIKSLQNQLPPQSRNCTTFELITATLWKCRTIALEHDPNEIVRISCAISLRGKRYNMNLPPGYYGNAFAFPAVCSNVERLRKSPLGYAVELVKQVKGKMNEEYIRSVADLMVTKERRRHTTNGNFIVSDNTRIGFEEINFGWGKPLVGGPARAISIVSFYVNCRKDDKENGIIVPICLPSSTVGKFQEELRKMIQGVGDYIS